MKVDDLGLGQLPQAIDAKGHSSATSYNRVNLFDFIITYQFDSQKLRIFSFLAFIFSILQSIYISFWPYLDLSTKKLVNQFDFIRYPPIYEENITVVFFFYINQEELSTLYLNSFVILAVSAFFLILSVIYFCLYYFKRIINYQLLLIFNFFVQFICPILIIPLGFQIGSVISKILMIKNLESYETEEIYTAILVLDIIMYIIIVLITIMNNIFNSNSLIVAKSFLATYDGIFESYITIVPSIILMFSSFLPFYYSSIRYVLVAIHSIFCVSVVIWSFWIPFGIIRSNSFISAVYSSMIISDFLCFTEMNTKWYRYLVFLGCCIAFYFLYYLLIRIRINSVLKIKKNKNKNEQQQQQQDEPLLKDENIKINQNETKNNHSTHSLLMQEFNDPSYKPTGFENLSISKSLFILRLAIITKSNVFLDGKLVDLILAKIVNDPDRIQLGFLICYFPEFQAVFFSVLMALKRAQYLSFLKEFQLYQLRCFDLASRPDSKIDEIKNLSLETSALEIHIQSLWQAIDSECSSYNNNIENRDKIKSKLDFNLFSSMDRLSTAIFNCHSKWITTLTFYPNSIDLTAEYSKFLIKCFGDFIGASEWDTISTLIKDGKTFKFNPASVSFLKAFPQYGKEIYPKKTLLVNLDDVDIQNKTDNIDNLVEMAEARLEYQRSTYSSYPISILVFLLFSFISFLFIMIYWSQSLRSFLHFDAVTESLYFVLETGLLGEQIAKCFINVIMDFGQDPSINCFPSPDDFFNTVFNNGVSDRMNSFYDYLLIDFSGDYRSQIETEVEVGMGYLDNLHLAALEQVEEGNSMDNFFSLFFSQAQPNIFYISKSDSVTSVTSVSNPQSILVSFFTYYYTIAFNNNFEFLNDTKFYDETLGGNQILDILENVSMSVVQNNEEVLKDIDYANSTRLYIIVIIYILFSCLSIWINFIFIKKSFNKIANSLCYFPQNVMQKATLTILKKKNDSIIIINNNTDNNNNNNNNNNNDDDEEFYIDNSYINGIQSKIKNFVIIALAISTIVHIALGALIFSFHFVYIKYKKQILSCISLIHNFSFESFRVVELLYSIMAANAFGRILPSVDQKYKERLVTVRNNFLKSHQARWSYSIEGDCGIKGEFSASINKIRNMEKCPNWMNKSYHELIACLSEESGMNAFIDMTDSLINNIQDPHLMKSDSFIQYFYFINANLYSDVSSYDLYITSAVLEKDADYINNNQVFAASSFIISFLLLILNILIYFKIRGVFKLLFAFISRVNPSDLINNNHLLDALFGIKNMNKIEIQNNDTSFLVQESSLPIVFMDRSTFIEYVNMAFTRKFGYEANFIVGQPISTLIDDESILYHIDKMKFFGNQSSISKTILFRKENGNKILFDVTVIPIHNKLLKKFNEKQKNKTDEIDSENGDNDLKDSFVNRIAIVFNDKNSEKNLEKKCKNAQLMVDKLLNCIYPDIFSLFIEGYLKTCAVCFIKLPNSFPSNFQSKNILSQYSNMYDILYEKLKIFPLLEPLYVKNEIFAVVGCKKNDFTELAIECLNFAFNVFDEFSNLLKIPHNRNVTGQFFAVIEANGELNIGWLGNQIGKVVVTGELIDRAKKVLDNASYAGTVCTSKQTYEYLMQNDYMFYEKEIPEEICGSNYIFAIEKDSNIQLYRPNGDNYSSENESKNETTSQAFFMKMKEEEAIDSDVS